MAMTVESITARLEGLRGERDRMVADLHAVDGAIQDCEYWLNEVSTDGIEETNTKIKAGAEAGAEAGSN